MPNKTADIVVIAYLNEVYYKFGGGHTILPDSGSDFKNKLFMDVASQLGIKHIFSSPCRPKANGKLNLPTHFLRPVLRYLQ